MDKAEYRIKLEQINSLAEAGDFKGAAAVVDTIDWRHVKSVRTLCMVGEIYEANKRYEDSKRVLQYAYKRSSISKTVLYRLAEINIRTGDYDDAKRFYNEFEQLSPHDTSRYILKYKLLRAEDASLDDQIAVLKEYKEREYTERWAYELAKLYMKNGQKQKCIEECDEMILWFAEGKYVTRAMELKMKLRALSDPQKKKYNDRYAAEEKETAETARQEESMTAEERVSRAADLAADEEELPAAGKKEKKFSAADIIQKMDAAADETVSSALGQERTGTVAAMAQVAQRAAATQEAVEEAAMETAGYPRAAIEKSAKKASATARISKEPAEKASATARVAQESAEQASADLEEAAAWKAAAIEESAAETVRKSVAMKAAEDEAAREAAAAKEKAAALAKQFREQANAEAAEEAAWRAAAVEEAEPEAVQEAAPIEVITEDAAKKAAAASDEAIELVKESAEQASDEAAETAAWKAAVAANEAGKSVQKTAVEEMEGAAIAEAVEEAAWTAAAKEAAESAAETACASAEKAEAMAKARETKASEVAEAEVEAAETEAAKVAKAAKAMEVEAAEAAEAVKAEAVEVAEAEVEAAETEAAKIAKAVEAQAAKVTEAVKAEAARVAEAEKAEAARVAEAEKAEAARVAEAAKAAKAEAERAAEVVKAEAAEAVEKVEAAEAIAATKVSEVVEEVTAETSGTETVEVDESLVEAAEAVQEAVAEEVAPISPEELARSADEEAERALQELMASFLNEFAVSGDEYKMTTDIIPDEEEIPEKAAVPETSEDQNDPERMLGKETDESLGLTRTESFQEQLKKALEEGGNYEEANQIVIPEDLESPEDAAKRTVMTAHGLEYNPDEEAAEEGDATEEAAAGEYDESAAGEDSDSAEAATEDSDSAEASETSGEDGDNAEAADEESESAEAAGEGSDSAETSGEDSENVETSGEATSETDAETAGEEGASGEGTFAENAEGQESDGEEAPEPEPEPVKPEPEIMERVAVMPRKFTEEERALFSYFADIPGISEQASLALADIHNNAGDKTSKSGNVLIMGRQLSGKTRLADALICAACLDLNIEAAKVAKVIGEDLNEKDPAEVVDRMAGGFLLIEGAGSMSDEFVEGLNKAMEFRTDDLIVILEDEKVDLANMLEKHGEFAKKFTSRIIIPVFTNDELVTFARTYANEKGYKLDEMGTLALYTMIGENQTDTEPVVVGNVKKMVDRAIERSKGPKIASLFRKNTANSEGRNWLKEKDFRF